MKTISKAKQKKNCFFFFLIKNETKEDYTIRNLKTERVGENKKNKHKGNELI